MWHREDHSISWKKILKLWDCRVCFFHLGHSMLPSLSSKTPAYDVDSLLRWYSSALSIQSQVEALTVPAAGLPVPHLSPIIKNPPPPIRAPLGAKAYPWILSKYFLCIRACVRPCMCPPTDNHRVCIFCVKTLNLCGVLVVFCSYLEYNAITPFSSYVLYWFLRTWWLRCW